MNCKNCDQLVEGNFCSNCGQNSKVGRFNFLTFIKEVSGSIFQLNRGILFTAKELFIRPGKTIREYLGGKRKRHFKPLAYTFTLSTILYFLSKYLGGETQISDFIEGFNGDENEFKNFPEFLSQLDWLAKNYSYTILMLLPLNSLASYIAFKGFGYNYLEHLVLNAYITGQQAIIYLIVSLLKLGDLNSEIMATLSFLSSITYTFIVFWQFFSTGKKFSRILRFILTYFLDFILLLIGIILLFQLGH